MGNKTSKFRKITNKLLEKRFQKLLKGEELTPLSIKMFFYEAIKEFYKKHNNLDDLDISPDYDLDGQLRYFNRMITLWIQNKIKKIKDKRLEKEVTQNNKIDPDILKYWSIFRRELQLITIQRANLLGHSGDSFLESNITKVRTEASILILAEREILAQKIQEELKNQNYTVNIITTGMDITKVAEVIETLILLNEDQKYNERLLVLFLHDYDIYNIIKLINLQEYYPKLVSCGINPEMISEYNIDYKKIQEPYSHKKIPHKFKIGIRTIEKTKYKNWIQQYNIKNKRIDVEKLYIYYGIDYFIKYIKNIINQVNNWNLLRIENELTFSNLPNQIKELEQEFYSLWNLLIQKIKTKTKWTNPIKKRSNEIQILLKNYKGSLDEGIKKIEEYRTELQNLINSDNNIIKCSNQIEEIIDKIESLILDI